tara:strand:- start:52 stop:423 length:372 start_codon:yes stop_codon:yes gene_type:complete
MWKRIKVYMGLADKWGTKVRSAKVEEKAPEENSGVSPKLNKENLLNAANSLMDVSSKYVVYLNQYLKDLEGLEKVEEKSFLNADDIEFLIDMIANSNHKGSKFKKVITVTEKLKAQYEKLIKT